MPLKELKLNLLAGETVKITGPAQLEIKGGVTASAIGQQFIAASSKSALVGSGGAKTAFLVGGGKVSAAKVSSTAVASGAVLGLTPTLLIAGGIMAVGYMLFRLNDKVIHDLIDKKL